MKLKEIPEEFKQTGLKLKLVKRTKYVALYEYIKPIGYEVHIIRTVKVRPKSLTYQYYLKKGYEYYEKLAKAGTNFKTKVDTEDTIQESVKHKEVLTVFEGTLVFCIIEEYLLLISIWDEEDS